MLVQALAYYEQGDLCGSFRQLTQAYWHCDGRLIPPDFVKGEARAGLATLLKEIMADMAGDLAGA